MVNARRELISCLEGMKPVAADITAFDKRICLKAGYSESDFEAFLKQLDFEYDDGYGTQYVDGIVWLEDGKWLEREEYDGSEEWRHMGYPAISEDLR